VGIDPDPKALRRATAKAVRAGTEVRFDRGFAGELPYADASFDRVLSSFVFHHLDSTEKERMLREARRVLKPGGSLHLLDFDGPDGGGGHSLSHWIRTRPVLAGNGEERILSLVRRAGFGEARAVAHGRLFLRLLPYTVFRGSAVPAAGTAAV
jgi:ubiquinone/menaquinone biosynthesis C-methylase UbiE